MSKLFLHLLNISITAGWIVLIVTALRFVLKRAPKWIRVALWGLVALRLLLPVSVQSVLSLVPSAETVSVETVTYPASAQAAAPAPVQGERIVIETGFSALNSAVNPTAEQAAKQVDTVAVLKTVAVWVWLSGAAVMLLYALISYLRLRHRVRASVRLEKGAYLCDDIKSPFILGLFLPKIYLPSGTDGATKGYVLAHERAHLRRFDHVWKPLGFLLLSVYWFNPLLWLAYILLCRDIELACDEKVVKEYDDAAKAAYSEALVKSSVSRRSIAACPLAFGETGVKSRVKSILNYKKPAFWIILVALLAGIVTAVCFLTVPKKDKPEAEPDTTSVPGATGKVLEWFNYRDAFYELPWDGDKEITIDVFPNVTFRWTAGSVEAIEPGKTRTLFTGMPIFGVFFTDVTGDGKPELCASVMFGSGMIDMHVIVYDYANKQSYTLWDRGKYDYQLLTTPDGVLYVEKRRYGDDKSTGDGTLMMQDGLLCCRWSNGSVTPLNRELHESEVLGEWIVEEEWDNDGNVLYTFDVASTWKEYNFREDGTVTYNETVPISSNYDLAFGHPVSYPYEVHDDYVYIAGDDTAGAFRFGQSDHDTRTLTLMQNTDAGTVYTKLRRMGTEGPQTIEEILLGTYVCTGAEQNGVSIPIPAEYAGMTIDLGDTSEGDTYKHTSTVTIGGETMDGHGWTLDEDDMLLVWNQKTGKSMRFDWFTKQTACTTLKLTIEQADPITLIFTVEDDALPAPNVVMPEANADTTDALDEATLCTVWQLTEIEAPDGSSGDPKGILIEQFLDFRTDGTVHFIQWNGENYSQATFPYSYSGDSVTVGRYRFVYDPAAQTLSIHDPDPDDIAVWIFARTPDAKLPVKEAALVGTWVVHSMDLDGTDVTNDKAFRKYRDMKIELYRSGKAVIYGADERWSGSGFTWIADDADKFLELAVTLRNGATGVGCSLAINGDYETNDGLLSAFGDYFFADADPDLYMLFERDELTPLPSASIAVPSKTDASQTLEEMLLGIYTCTGATAGGAEIAIPEKYVGMQIDLGDAYDVGYPTTVSEYFHIASVALDGIERTGYDWTVDADDMLTVRNDETGDTWTFQWMREENVLLLTLDQTDASGNPIVLIFPID